MNRVHTISVPYAVMKACPLSWVQRVHIHKGADHTCTSVFHNTPTAFSYKQSLLCFCSSCRLGEMSWPALGHDGTQRAERHNPGLLAHADRRGWSQSLWDMLISLPPKTVQGQFQRPETFVIQLFPLPPPPFPLSFCLSVSGSVSSCDAFLNVFQAHGLKPEVICPCATSPEAMTVAIRRCALKDHTLH